MIVEKLDNFHDVILTLISYKTNSITFHERCRLMTMTFKIRTKSGTTTVSGKIKELSWKKYYHCVPEPRFINFTLKSKCYIMKKKRKKLHIYLFKSMNLLYKILNFNFFLFLYFRCEWFLRNLSLHRYNIILIFGLIFNEMIITLSATCTKALLLVNNYSSYVTWYFDPVWVEIQLHKTISCYFYMIFST